MLACRVPLPAVHHHVKQEFCEPVMRLMLVIEQNLRTVARAFVKPIPPVVMIPGMTGDESAEEGVGGTFPASLLWRP